MQKMLSLENELQQQNTKLGFTSDTKEKKAKALCRSTEPRQLKTEKNNAWVDEF